MIEGVGFVPSSENIDAVSFFQAQDLSRDLTRKEVKQRANKMVEGLVAKTCTSLLLGQLIPLCWFLP